MRAAPFVISSDALFSHTDCAHCAGVDGLTRQQTLDAMSAVSTARVTGSVGAKMNDVRASRLYTATGGIGGTHTATDWWLITVEVDQ